MREVSLAAVDPATFRAVLGRFCSGITVITALGPDGPLGLTCQSFSSLSLAPAAGHHGCAARSCSACAG